MHNGKQWLIERFTLNHITAASLTNFNEVNDTATAKLNPIWNLKRTPAEVLPEVCAAVEPKLAADGSIGGG